MTSRDVERVAAGLTAYILVKLASAKFTRKRSANERYDRQAYIDPVI